MAKSKRSRKGNWLLISFLTLSAVVAVGLSLTFALAGEATASQEQPTQEKKEDKPVQKAKDGSISAEYAEALAAKAAELDRREKDLIRREQQVKVLEQEVDKRAKAIDAEREKFENEKQVYLDQRAAEEEVMQSERINKIANIYKNYKANVAALQLEVLYTQDKRTALIILSKLDPRVLSKIFAKMNGELAVEMMEEFRLWKIAQNQAAAGTTR